MEINMGINILQISILLLVVWLFFTACVWSFFWILTQFGYCMIV